MNKPLVALGLITVAAVAFYLYQSNSSGTPLPEEKKKKKPKSKKSKEAASAKVDSELQDLKKKSEVLRQQGNKKFGLQEYEEAIELYTQAIEASPKTEKDNIAKCYGNRAYCNIKLNNFDSGIADCTEALEYDSKYIKALQRRAGAYEEQGKLELAIDDYMYMMKLAMPANPRPENVTKQQEEGMAAIEKLLQKIAAKKAKIAIAEKVGQFPAALILRSYLDTFARSPITESIEEIKQRMEHDKTAKYTLGQKLVNEDKFKEALQIFNEILEEEPNHFLAKVDKATLLHLSGSIAEALVCFEEANNINPDDPHTLVKWANALVFASETDKANQLLEKAIEISPDDSVALFHSGEAASVQGKHEDAIKCYSKVIEMDPKHYEAYNHRGLAYMSILESKGQMLFTEAGTIAKAQRTFEKAIEILPNKADAYNNYGLLLGLLQKTDNAIAQFDKALGVDPNNSTAYTRKGFLSLHAGNFDNAVQMFEKAISLEDQNIEAHCNLSLTLLTLNKVDEAIKCYDKAIANSSVLSLDLPQIFYYRDAAEMQRRFEQLHGNA